MPVEPSPALDAAQLAGLLASLPDPFFALDAQGCFTYINEAAARFGGRAEVASLLGRPWQEVMPQARGGRFEAELARVAQGGVGASWDEYAPEPGLWTEARLFPLPGGGVAVHFRDVSERARGQEQDLRLFDTLTLGVVFQDAGGHITRANSAAERILGLTLAQLQGLDSFDPRWRAVDEQGEDLPGERHPSQRALAEGVVVQGLMGVFNPRLDELRWLNVTAVPQIRQGEARPYQVYTVFEDVTGAQRTRAALRESEARYARLVEASHQYVWTNTPAGELRGEQPGWRALTGQSPAEYEGHGWAGALHPEDRAQALAAWRAAVAAGEPYEVEQRVRTASGEYRHFQVRGLPLKDERGQVREWVGIHSDITALKTAEAGLRELNSSLEARVRERTEALEGLARFNSLLLTAAGEGIFGMDLTGRTSFANPAAARILGYRPEELIGRDQHALVHHSHPDGAPYAAADCPIRATLHSGEVRRVADEVFWHKGGHAVPVEYTAAPLYSPGGELQGTVVIFQDISERVSALRELTRSNAELEQFAYVASHDLQEPLRTVGSYAELLARRYAGQLDERALRYLDFMQSGVGRMRQLITDLLGYARLGREAPHPRRVSLDELLDRVLASLAAVIEETHTELRRPAPLPELLADPGSLEQVLSNLIVNAIKFRRPDAAPVVRVSARRDGECWRVEVADNGIGVAPEYRERVFGVFQRLHRRDEYEGTGIGLAVVRRIVEAHGGVVGVDDAPEGGSRFFFTLPAALDEKPGYTPS